MCKLDLLEEFEDEQDKRSRRVRLRPAGRQLLGELFYKMTQLSQLVTADLDDQEKFELLSLLEHLNRFHLKLYHDKALDSLDELVKILPPPAT